MKIELLRSTFDGAQPSAANHLVSLVIDDRVAVDAGSLAMGASPLQREQVRDVIISHSHLDHIAGLPMFIDDLFASADQPVTVHALEEVIGVLEGDIFNGRVYPKFAEFENSFGKVLKYSPFTVGETFEAAHLRVTSVPVSHGVPSSGFILSDGESNVAVSGDTSGIKAFWNAIGAGDPVDAVVVECAFPNEMGWLAEKSHHLTPATLSSELSSLGIGECRIYVTNIKPYYHGTVVRQLADIGDPRLSVLVPGVSVEV